MTSNHGGEIMGVNFDVPRIMGGTSWLIFFHGVIFGFLRRKRACGARGIIKRFLTWRWFLPTAFWITAAYSLVSSATNRKRPSLRHNSCHVVLRWYQMLTQWVLEFLGVFTQSIYETLRVFVFVRLGARIRSVRTFYVEGKRRGSVVGGEWCEGLSVVFIFHLLWSPL